MLQWVTLHTSNAGSMSMILGQGCIVQPKDLKTKLLKLSLTHHKDYVSDQHYIHFQIQDDLNR